MLFGYPIIATEENWFHNCLYEMLQLIHTCIQSAQTIPDWPEIIPVLYRARLIRRTALKDRLLTYKTALGALSSNDRERVYNALTDQNKIALLLSCNCNCDPINNLPKAIQSPVLNLFDFAFDRLTDLGVRDKHYKIIYDRTPDHLCPFCGCEYFDAPGAPREALDHYLPKSKYPFAAANLRNLVPMGTKCNSRYKLAKDILYQADNVRRKSYDPYNHERIRISLDNSQPFAGAHGVIPDWQIEFEPETEETTTWDDVFQIRERYKRDILDTHFNRWLTEFSAWCKYSLGMPASDQELICKLDSYASYLEDIGINDRAFLKAAVFRMLQKHCRQGDSRLVLFIKDTINGHATIALT